MRKIHAAAVVALLACSASRAFAGGGPALNDGLTQAKSEAGRPFDGALRLADRGADEAYKKAHPVLAAVEESGKA